MQNAFRLRFSRERRSRVKISGGIRSSQRVECLSVQDSADVREKTAAGEGR
ncbi:hypothetical protein KFK09_004396 [Dendrobium nobile]|uniref:Uncharacterized protein n=1 Tax=Dendrobium nobile TaxID=94219 RepID=A0A8T3C0B3_DENNO|nr:hypothetical protein KFK09_004396 [Dendrobium nobile]